MLKRTDDMTFQRCAAFTATLFLAGMQCAAAKVSTVAGHASAVAYIDFPAAIDPDRSHKHVAMKAGSRLYYRTQIVVRQLVRSTTGVIVEQAFLVDAASRITRLGGETLVVEPDGSRWHLSPAATIERGGYAHKYIVIPPNSPIPEYLQSARADVYVR